MTKKTFFDRELESLWREGLSEEEAARLIDELTEAGNIPAPTGLRSKLQEIGVQKVKGSFFSSLPLAPTLAGVAVMSVALIVVVRPLTRYGLEPHVETPSQVEEDGLEWTAEDLFLGGNTELFDMEDVL